MLEKQTLQKMGDDMYSLMERLFPICRSITGAGVRETLEIIKEHIPIEIKNVPTGTPVFDWKVPKEWNIKDAWVKNEKGEKIIDFQKNNLHVLNYSTPIHQKMQLNELKEHLRTLPDHPDWIPYATSYYKENWGFCLSQNDFDKLEDGEYEVFIDSSLEDGNLTYGELVLPGETDEEIVMNCYVCHPSMCNDNLSGVVLLTELTKYLQNKDRHFTYRLLFIPETIGSITWLAQNENTVERIKHGLVVTCVGDKGETLTYKKSREGNNEVDLAAEKVLEDFGCKFDLIDFNPAEGSDERQWCSPGFNLPFGSLMRTVYVHFPEYHTSADNLSTQSPETLADTLEKYIEILFVLDNNKTYQSLAPKGEPQLGRRGLYRQIGAPQGGVSLNEAAVFWMLNYADGKHSLLDIAKKSGLTFRQVKGAADACKEAGLLEEKV